MEQFLCDNNHEGDDVKMLKSLKVAILLVIDNDFTLMSRRADHWGVMKYSMPSMEPSRVQPLTSKVMRTA